LVYPPAQKIISIFSIRGAPCTIEGVLQHDEGYQQHEVMTPRIRAVQAMRSAKLPVSFRTRWRRSLNALVFYKRGIDLSRRFIATRTLRPDPITLSFLPLVATG